MKKTAFAVIGLIALSLCSCDISSKKTNDISEYEDQLNDYEKALVIADVTKNSSSLCKVTMKSEGTTDYSPLYGDQVPTDYMYSQVSASKTSVHGSNYAVATESKLSAKVLNNGVMVSKSVETKNVYAALPNPQSIKDAGGSEHGLYILYKQKESGYSHYGSSYYSNYSYDADKDLDSAFSYAYVDLLLSYLPTASFYRDGDKIAAVIVESTNGTMANPIYPGDKTKTIALNTFESTVYTINKDAAAGYRIDSLTMTNKTTAPLSFYGKAISDPLNNDLISYSYEYGVREEISVPFTAEEVVAYLNFCPVLVGYQRANTEASTPWTRTSTQNFYDYSSAVQQYDGSDTLYYKTTVSLSKGQLYGYEITTKGADEADKDPVYQFSDLTVSPSDSLIAYEDGGSFYLSDASAITSAVIELTSDTNYSNIKISITLS